MKKYKIIALTLSLLLLAGCSAKVNQISFSERKNQSYVIAEKDEEPEDLSLEDVFQEAAAQNDKTVDAALPDHEETGQTPEPGNILPAGPDNSHSDPPAPSEAGQSDDAGSDPVPADDPEPSVPDPEPDPEPDQPVIPEPDPEPDPVPEPDPEPEFDIGYWISYARNAALEKGLSLSPSAVDCWDNPITANAGCIYLERDISARLSRYAGDEDITDVWIWYENTGPGSYLIYIGYA